MREKLFTACSAPAGFEQAIPVLHGAHGAACEDFSITPPGKALHVVGVMI
ncbi:MAG: hypothetical protein O8C66_06205 [Candidatus Methanoperedens sp.]|nr:hypothetical protein [Candidatus Methanoperedens sp.]MCZ7370083.1 hypothetical protein [Candidatus Methanoperedens sp.]